MPGKAAQTSLLKMQGAFFAGQGLIGIFFPFFVQDNFALTDWQILLWFAVIQVMAGFVVYPLNVLGTKYFGVEKTMTLGIFSCAIFYTLLALNITGLLGLVALTLSFIVFMCGFWPNFNYLSLQATKDGTRGNYLGNTQVVRIGVGLACPITTGFLLEVGLETWVLLVAIACFVLTLYWTRLLGDSSATLGAPGAVKKVLSQTLFHPQKFWGFLSDAIISGTMWMIWPVYFKAVAGTFVIMGAITSLAAFVEIFASKFIGRLTDKFSAKKMLEWGVWARFCDLGLRAVYMKFSGIPVIVSIQSAGSVLGPAFQIAAETRVYEVGENLESETYEYFVIREIFLDFVRAFWIGLSAVLVYHTDTIYLGFIFLLAGLSAFWFRKL